MHPHEAARSQVPLVDAVLYIAQVYHLNLSFSSIPPSEYETVISTCYGPLLDVAEKYGHHMPIGVEMSGWTLERINAINPQWVDTLKFLQSKGKVEVISGGYNQIIFPLAPYCVNEANFRIGQAVFKEILGPSTVPQTLLTPEQCWSDALPKVAHDAGFRNIITEYHNCAALHPEWPVDQRYKTAWLTPYPDKHPLKLVWSDAVVWQQFQRFVQALDRHTDGAARSYIDSILKHYNNTEDRLLMLYASDAEVFDYRPGKGKLGITEFDRATEWQCIGWIVERLSNKLGVQGINISNIPASLTPPDPLGTIGTAACPHPTKKQSKYNPTRWAVTGLAGPMNWQAWEILKTIHSFPFLHPKVPLHSHPMEVQKDVLKLWGSDYRTHTCHEKQSECKEIFSRLMEYSKSLWPLQF